MKGGAIKTTPVKFNSYKTYVIRTSREQNHWSKKEIYTGVETAYATYFFAQCVSKFSKRL